MDVSYVGTVRIGTVTVLNYDSLDLLETQVTSCQVKNPTFRRCCRLGKFLLARAAIEKHDVFLFDAQGFAYPYRRGFASYLGFALGKTTVGAAKSS